MDVLEILDTIKKDQAIKESIGTQKEKTIHQFLKYYLCNDSSNHEIKIGKNIIDVFIDNHIYEIQTKGFHLLRDKLTNLLDKYPFTIVYPICTNKLLYKINDFGEVISERKSPKKTHPLLLTSEMYKIKNFLKHPNLSFKIILLDVIELQTTRLNRRKQIRNTRIDQYPRTILDVIDINKTTNLFKIFPNIDNFTSSEYLKTTKMGKRDVGNSLNVLRYLDVLKVDGKIKNAYVYKVNKTPNF